MHKLKQPSLYITRKFDLEKCAHYQIVSLSYGGLL